MPDILLRRTRRMLSAALGALLLPLSLAAQPENLAILLGPPQVLLGPTDDVDSPFHTVRVPAGLQGYVANAATRVFRGSSLDTLQLAPAPALQKGRVGAFDSCGAWLEAVRPGDGVVHGWYHAEAPTPACDAGQWVTRKSIAYAVSQDGGMTFQKPGYPNNVVLSSPPHYDVPSMDDEGDFRIIRKGEYLYLYFLANHDSRGWRIHLARSPVAQGGLPGTWTKYHQGAFSQPGVGGESSPLTQKYADLSSSWVVFNRDLGMYMGFGSVWHGKEKTGITLSFSPDGLAWRALPFPLLPTTGQFAGRGAASPELVGYTSLIATDGDSETVGSTLWLYYMYVNPGETLRGARHLVRRKVVLSQAGSREEAVPRIPLVAYGKGQARRVSTMSTEPRVRDMGTTLGLLYTDQVAKAERLVECRDARDWVAQEAEGCGSGRQVRLLGWIPQEPGPGRAALVRCGPRGQTHVDSGCAGDAAPTKLGYILEAGR